MSAFLAVWPAGFQLLAQQAHEHQGERILDLKYRDIPSLLDRHNLRLRASQSRLAANAARLGLTDESFYPKFELKSSFESFRTGSANVKWQPTASAVAILNVYNGGLDKIAENLTSSQQGYLQAERTILRKNKLAAARKLFWEYVYHDKILSVYDDAARWLVSAQKQTQKRIAAGTAARSESIEFELRLLKLQQAKEAAQQRQRTQQKELLVELGLHQYSGIHVEHTPEDADFWQKRFNHDESHHKILLEKFAHHRRSKQLQIERIKASAGPSLELFGGLAQHNEREKEASSSWRRFEQFVGVGISMQVDTKSIMKKERLALAEEMSAVELDEQAELAEVEQHLNLEGQEIEFLRSKVAQFPAHLALLKKHHKMTLEDFRLGNRNSEDVIAVILEILETQLEYAELTSELNAKLSHMESYFQ
jgi:outer membrane protein TolC